MSSRVYRTHTVKPFMYGYKFVYNYKIVNSGKEHQIVLEARDFIGEK